MNEADQAASGGRVNQKARTRSALLESALRLIRQGRRPTVEEAALAAGISKRTAYRYFTSQEHMLADAALDALRPRMDDLLAATDAAPDVHTRIAALAVALSRLATTHEAELRVMIRATMDQAGKAGGPPDKRTRGRRRLEWIETAIRPMEGELSPDQHARLVNSLAVCLGIDAVVVLRDICGIVGEAAEQTMVWMATAMVDRALAENKRSGRI